MKKVLWLALLACGTMMLAGCGNKADENKTPAQIQAEVQKMDAAQIQAVIADYQKAIEKKPLNSKKKQTNLLQFL